MSRGGVHDYARMGAACSQHYLAQAEGVTRCKRASREPEARQRAHSLCHQSGDRKFHVDTKHGGSFDAVRIETRLKVVERHAASSPLFAKPLFLVRLTAERAVTSHLWRQTTAYRRPLAFLACFMFVQVLCCCLCIIIAAVIAVAGNYITTFESLF